MTRLAITGHRELPEDTERWVNSALRDEIGRRAGGELVGLSCVADCAESILADAVLDAGGRLIVVISAQRYRDGLPVAHRPDYDRLVNEAGRVIRLPMWKPLPKPSWTPACT